MLLIIWTEQYRGLQLSYVTMEMYLVPLHNSITSKNWTSRWPNSYSDSSRAPQVILHWPSIRDDGHELANRPTCPLGQHLRCRGQHNWGHAWWNHPVKCREVQGKYTGNDGAEYELRHTMATSQTRWLETWKTNSRYSRYSLDGARCCTVGPTSFLMRRKGKTL